MGDFALVTEFVTSTVTQEESGGLERETPLWGVVTEGPAGDSRREHRGYE